MVGMEKPEGLYVKFHEHDPADPSNTDPARIVIPHTPETWTFEHAWVYDTPTNERRHWWQFWRKRQRLLWNGPVERDD